MPFSAGGPGASTGCGGFFVSGRSGSPGVLFLVVLFWVAFSIGQALLAPNGGSMSSKLAEWARGHYLGPVVTFGEWLTYDPPKVGGKPSFSLAVPSGEAVGPSRKPACAVSSRP